MLKRVVVLLLFVVACKKESEVKVSSEGVEVKTPTGTVKTGKDGVEVTAPGTDVKTTKDGVEVSTPGVAVKVDSTADVKCVDGNCNQVCAVAKTCEYS